MSNQTTTMFENTPKITSPPNPETATGVKNPWQGQRVGAYHLRKYLGRSSECSVFRGVSNSGEAVIAKVFHNDGPIRLKALQEARMSLADLDHPAIVTPIAIEQTRSGRPVLIRPHVEGLDILSWCEQNKLDYRQRLDLFLELCELVAVIHDAGLAHRNLKPGNIIINEGRIAITDLMVGGMLDAFTDPLASMADGQKSPSWHASPEQVLKHRVTKATDIYALGALFYHLVTGNPPYRFDQRSAWEIRWMISCMDPEKPGRHLIRTATIQSDHEDTLRGLDHIIDKSMAKHPEIRYTTVERLMADVRKVANERLDGRGNAVNKLLHRLKKARVFDI